MTLTARLCEELALQRATGGLTGRYCTAAGVAARLGESTARVSRALARLASRGEAVQRVCCVRQGAPARWCRLYVVTSCAGRAAARRGRPVLEAGPRVGDPARDDEIDAADFDLPRGKNRAIMGYTDSFKTKGAR